MNLLNHENTVLSDRKNLVQIGAKVFFKSVMMDGFFHGDLHGGNLFSLPEGRLGMIDFGLVGRLSQKSRDQIIEILVALLAEDYESLCYAYTELGNIQNSIDFESFQRDVRNTIAPYMGLSLAHINIGKNPD